MTVAGVAIGGAQYSVLCNEDGGVLDDVITYRLEAERYLTVTNAANHARDVSWFADHAGTDVTVVDRAPDYAMIAVQGPLAREIVQAIASAPLPERMAVGDWLIYYSGKLHFGAAEPCRRFTAIGEGHRMPIQTVVVQIQAGKKVPIYPASVAAAAGGKFVPLPPYAWEKK